MTKRIVPLFPQEGLQFLRSLKRHNNREWFLNNKSIYENHVKQPMTNLIEELALEFKKFAPEMVASPKVSSYRIHRDTRFTNDKSPYKTHVAAVFPHMGLGKHEGAGFYVQIGPDELLIGGGLYMPLPEDLRAIRAHIAERPQQLIQILKDREFRKAFGEISGEQLSRVPRRFPADHVAAQYLRYKQFLAGRRFDGQVAATRNFFSLLVDTFRTLLPFVRFLNQPILAERRTRERQHAMLEL